MIYITHTHTQSTHDHWDLNVRTGWAGGVREFMVLFYPATKLLCNLVSLVTFPLKPPWPKAAPQLQAVKQTATHSIFCFCFTKSRLKHSKNGFGWRKRNEKQISSLHRFFALLVCVLPFLSTPGTLAVLPSAQALTRLTGV